MSGAPTLPTVDELDQRLRELRRRQVEDQARRAHSCFMMPRSVAEFAGRAFNDLVAALLIAIAVGAGLDGVFGIFPFGTLAMFLLGAAAAVRNVYQTANRMSDQAVAEQAQETIRRD